MTHVGPSCGALPLPLAERGALFAVDSAEIDSWARCVYGDRIFEKRGKGRDGAGNCGKLRYFQGIGRSFGRDRGGGVSFILRLGRRILRPSFLRSAGPERAHRGGGSVGGPCPPKEQNPPENRVKRAFQGRKKEGGPRGTVPEVTAADQRGQALRPMVRV